MPCKRVTEKSRGRNVIAGGDQGMIPIERHTQQHLFGGDFLQLTQHYPIRILIANCVDGSLTLVIAGNSQYAFMLIHHARILNVNWQNDTVERLDIAARGAELVQRSSTSDIMHIGRATTLTEP